jgi:hypothetical protein
MKQALQSCAAHFICTMHAKFDPAAFEKAMNALTIRYYII